MEPSSSTMLGKLEPSSIQGKVSSIHSSKMCNEGHCSLTSVFICLCVSSPSPVPYSGGCGRTGTYVAVSILIERLKTEGVVDVFHTVRNLRLQRPGMVQTEVNTIFCLSSSNHITVIFFSTFSGPVGILL